MLVCPKLILLGLCLLTTSCGGDCPVECKCIPLDRGSLRVDCGFKNLSILPSFPKETAELLLQGNQITAVPAGAFDNLVDLKKLNLSSNPLHCDCTIRYLMMWISDGDVEIDDGIRCASPLSLYGERVSQLAGSQIASCSRHPRLCSDFLFNDAFLHILIILLLFLMICCLAAFKKIKFQIKVSDHSVDSKWYRYTRARFLRRRSYTYWKDE